MAALTRFWETLCLLRHFSMNVDQNWFHCIHIIHKCICDNKWYVLRVCDYVMAYTWVPLFSMGLFILIDSNIPGNSRKHNQNRLMWMDLKKLHSAYENMSMWMRNVISNCLFLCKPSSQQYKTYYKAINYKQWQPPCIKWPWTVGYIVTCAHSSFSSSVVQRSFNKHTERLIKCLMTYGYGVALIQLLTTWTAPWM